MRLRPFRPADLKRSHTSTRWTALRGLLFVFLALACVACQEADPRAEGRERLRASDFAVGRTLTSRAPGLLQSVLLDYDVYRWSREPGLADLRVFDEAGEPVPYAMRAPGPRRSVSQASRALPVFRIEDSDRSRPDRRTRQHLGGNYRIDAELSDSGAIVRIHPDPTGSAPGTDSAAGRDPAAWILDASALGEAIRRLDFSVSAPDGDYLSVLRIDSSDDLARWKRVSVDAALVRLVHGEHRIERKRVDLPNVRARYLRVALVDPVPGLEIQGVQARLADRSRSTPRFPNEKHTVSGRYASPNSTHVLFDAGARLPIESLRLKLAEKNSIIEGQLESAPTAEGPWRVRQSGLFYSIEKGVTLRNARVAYRSNSDRYFRFRSTERGGGLGNRLPTLEIEWRPQQLMYVQRRPGAMQLAVGRVGTPDGAFRAGTLLGIDGRSGSDFPDATARLGPEVILAGEAALTRLDPIVPNPWRTYGLWALLLGSVGVIAALTFRLLGSIEDADEDSEPPTDSI